MRYSFVSGLKNYMYRIIAAEISVFSRYYDELIQWKELKNDSGTLFEKILCRSKKKLSGDEPLPDLSQAPERSAVILLNGAFNHSLDIQEILDDIRKKSARSTRVAAVVFNPYLKWMYVLANLLRLRQGDIPPNFITRSGIHSIARLSGFEVVKMRSACYVPFRLLGLGTLINKVLPVFPVIRWFGLATIIILRPVISEKSLPSLSIIIPARN